jgi:hypothetical protein
MSELGRISGALLKDNLLRNNKDLSFETDLLYLDVTHTRIGVHTAGPTRDLTIVGTTNIQDDIFVSNPAKIGNIILGTDGSISTIVGTLTISANDIYASALTTNHLKIEPNVISSISNSDIIIDPAGKLNIRSNTVVNADLEVTGNILIDNNIVILGNLYLGPTSEVTAISQISFEGTLNQNLFPTRTDIYSFGYYNYEWLNVYLGTSVQIGNVKIYNDNEITTSTSNTSLILSSNGINSKVKVENFNFLINTLSTNTNDVPFTITPEEFSSVIIDGTGAVKIPRSTNYVDRNTGDLRFDLLDNRYKGRNDLGSDVTFGGIFSGDRKTYVIPETTLNANDGVTNFVVNNTSVLKLQDNKFKTNKIELDNTSISTNIITTINNNNLSLLSNGSGAIIIDNLSFKDTEINNTSSSSNFVFSTSGSKGYVKVDNTTGLGMPSGDSNARPVSPPTGTTRFNTEFNYLESYDGTNWYPSYGPKPLLSQQEIEDTMLLYTLILGS